LARKSQVDHALETLLDLDGEVFPMNNGYWTKFEVRRVKPDRQRPHGIKYSLSLHDQYNQRVLGYDNAHSSKTKRKKYSGKRKEWDHKHREEKIEDYDFESASRLLRDFWEDADKYLK
jgi:hypothetical protein